MRDPVLRRVAGGIHLSFLLPALMGLFAQVGGPEQPQVRRVAPGRSGLSSIQAEALPSSWRARAGPPGAEGGRSVPSVRASGPA
ncbi:hypothetical protein ACIQZO_15860 [Streptomyces sp. NPDC097617]|uniref:hypothetical protein n=1 Tax=Streptomyces sp. NPDC097617 TaxID=3366091 RepID=UPI00381079E5